MTHSNARPLVVLCIADAEAGPWAGQLAKLLPGFEVTAWDAADRRQADYAIVWNPPGAFFSAQTRLKVIFNFGAGVDGILKLPQLPPGVPVIRAEDAGMAVQMAEYVSQAVIRFARGIGTAEAAIRNGQWTSPPAMRRDDYPVGIMGMGIMGACVARALAVFDYPLLGWSRSPRTVAGVRGYHGADGLDAFLRQVRVLVCLLPLTPDTAGILNRANLEKLLPGGYIINVARGGHLVEADLLALLATGRLAGAALDVFATEPLPDGHPFLTHPRIILTPHIAAQTMPDETLQQIAGKIMRIARDEPVTGTVDRASGY